MALPIVSIGIVTWNSALNLPATLDALVRQTYQILEILVVDNASTDDSVAQVRSYFPTVRVIINTENQGFCRAHNQGISASQGEYYLPLNPDAVLQPDYIAIMVDALEQQQKCGSAAGKLLRAPDVIDSTGLFVNRHRQQYLRGHGEPDRGQYDTPGEVFGVDGAAPLYRREMLEDIKIDGQYFDESFFAHKEDVDLAWRARLFGWGCWYCPKAIAFHERSFKPGQRHVVSPTIRMHAIKNRYLLLIKNELPSGWFRDGFFIAWYDLKIFVYVSLFERSSFKAISFIWKNRFRVLTWRHQIRHRMRIDPIEMLSWFQ